MQKGNYRGSALSENLLDMVDLVDWRIRTAYNLS